MSHRTRMWVHDRGPSQSLTIPRSAICWLPSRASPLTTLTPNPTHAQGKVGDEKKLGEEGLFTHATRRHLPLHHHHHHHRAVGDHLLGTKSRGRHWTADLRQISSDDGMTKVEYQIADQGYFRFAVPLRLARHPETRERAIHANPPFISSRSLGQRAREGPGGSLRQHRLVGGTLLAHNHGLPC